MALQRVSSSLFGVSCRHKPGTPKVRSPLEPPSQMRSTYAVETQLVAQSQRYRAHNRRETHYDERLGKRAELNEWHGKHQNR
jgi:hypothetical protein